MLHQWTCTIKRRIYKDSERKGEKFCLYITIKKISVTITCQDGSQLCILVEKFHPQSQRACNNKPKSNNDWAKDNIQQTLQSGIQKIMLRYMKNTATQWNWERQVLWLSDIQKREIPEPTHRKKNIRKQLDRIAYAKWCTWNCKQTSGSVSITFTNENGNIITDNDDEDEKHDKRQTNTSNN